MRRTLLVAPVLVVPVSAIPVSEIPADFGFAFMVAIQAP